MKHWLFPSFTGIGASASDNDLLAENINTVAAAVKEIAVGMDISTRVCDCSEGLSQLGSDISWSRITLGLSYALASGGKMRDSCLDIIGELRSEAAIDGSPLEKPDDDGVSSANVKIARRLSGMRSSSTAVTGVS
jgi:hypothetical protein